MAIKRNTVDSIITYEVETETAIEPNSRGVFRTQSNICGGAFFASTIFTKKLQRRCLTAL